LFIFECDNRAKKILFIFFKGLEVIIREGELKNIIPKSLTLLFTPSIRALIVRNEKICSSVRKQVENCFLIYIEF